MIHYDDLVEGYRLSKHAQDAIKLREIEISWINISILDFDKLVEVSHKEFHYYKKISNRCLKVVVNPINKNVVTTYFDRNMNKRGCK